jgi:hypothetical protein
VISITYGGVYPRFRIEIAVPFGGALAKTILTGSVLEILYVVGGWITPLK